MAPPMSLDPPSLLSRRTLLGRMGVAVLASSGASWLGFAGAQTASAGRAPRTEPEEMQWEKFCTSSAGSTQATSVSAV